MTTSHQQPATCPRAAINRANSRHSTGPRTPAGKQRSSLNALRHGLTAASPVLPSEDPAAYEAHRRRFFDEYQPATPTELQLVIEIADTSWRLNRIPLLEAELLSGDLNLQTLVPQLATIGIHSQRLSRQFQKTSDTLREIQSERRLQHERALKRAATLLELHKHKGIPYDPTQYGFVFSKEEVDGFAQRLMRLNESRHLEHVLFHMQPQIPREAARPATSSL
jgi:hypothetical protein